MSKNVTAQKTEGNVSQIDNVQETMNYKQFRSAGIEWLPEMKEAEAIEALVNDIKVRGLQTPIVVDQNFTVYDGRHRLAACQKAGVPVRYRVVSADQGEAAARSGLVHREMTVLDEARLVGYSIKAATAAFKDAKQNEALSMYMKSTFGWVRHTQSRTMGSYVNLHKEMTKKSEEDHERVLQAAREAQSVTGALKAINTLPSRQKEKANDSSTPKPPKADADGKIRIKTVQKQLQNLLDEVGNDPGEQELRKLHENLRGYLEKLKEKAA